jgi:hypothetical protein
VKKLLSIVALTATTFTAQAEVRINGFANLIGGITSSDETLYGYNDKMSFSEESLFAVQISGDINDKMTATGQLVARGDNDYKASFDWAYLTYQATDNLDVSVGRFRLPLFNYSASSEVGYSYHWVTTPQNVYDVQFNNLEGIKLDYSDYAGDWEYILRGAYGTFSDDGNGVLTDGNDTLLLSAEAVYESFIIRVVVGQANTSLDFSNADDPASIAAISVGLAGMRDAGIATQNANLVSLANDLEIIDDKATFSGLSVLYDNFDWFVGGEITEISVENSFANDDITYYVTAGTRIGKWTPSVTYQVFDAELDIKFQDKINNIALSPLPEVNKQQLAGLAQAVQAGQLQDYSVISATVRYDLDTNVALKVDISKLSDDIDPTADATVLRFAVNYVF